MIYKSMNFPIFGEFWCGPLARMAHWPADYVTVASASSDVNLIGADIPSARQQAD